MKRRAFLRLSAIPFGTLFATSVASATWPRSLRTGNRHEIAGETSNWVKAKAVDWYTGEEIKNVVEADERSGLLVRFKVDKHGKFVIINHEPQKVVEHRKLRIERPRVCAPCI